MVNKIYGDKVFDLMSNGEVFYKQGQVMELPNAGPGIYEAWRYNFDAGKQVFKATGTNKVYEKRLVKDSYGVPRWTSWMEIFGGEASGVQAIAVNDGILRLPNEDGAIKLEVTAAALNAYTKQETERLINHKINEYADDKYVYVPWPLVAGTTNPEAWTPKQVLEDAFPSGGETQHVYIVAAKPAAPPAVSAYPRVSQFVWDVVGGGAGGQLLYGWIETSGLAQIESFVPYSTFDAHRLDTDRDAPDIKHVTAEEKERIATAVKQLEFATHLTGDSIDPESGEVIKHVTDAEKRYWGSKMNAVPLSLRNKRYVAYTVDGVSTSWEEAFEQLSLGELDHTYWRPFGTAAHRVEGSSYRFEKNFKANTLTLLDGGSVPQDLVVTFTSLDTRGSDAYFIANDDPALRSPVWNTSHPNQPEFKFTFPLILGVDANQDPIYLDHLTYVTSAPAQTGTLIGGLVFDSTYFETNQVNFGLDTNHSVNFIGTQLKLNNKPINTDVPSYENIVGKPDDNEAIVKYVRERLYDKIGPTPDVKDVRYDAIDGRWMVQSLVQHTAKTNQDYRLVSVSNVLGANNYVRGGFQVHFHEAFADQNKIEGWEVTDVVVEFTQGIELPEGQDTIWFYVDDPKAEPSPIFNNGETTGKLEWHLGPCTDWDGIYIGNSHDDPNINSFHSIPQIDVYVKGIKFSGVEVGRQDKTMDIFSSTKPVATYGEGGSVKSSPIATMADVVAAIDDAFTLGGNEQPGGQPTDPTDPIDPTDPSKPASTVVVTKAKFDAIDGGVKFSSTSIDPRTSKAGPSDELVLKGVNGIRLTNEEIEGIETTTIGIDPDFEITDDLSVRKLSVSESAILRGKTTIGEAGIDDEEIDCLTVHAPSHFTSVVNAQLLNVAELHITGSMDIDDIVIPDNYTMDRLIVREGVVTNENAVIDGTSGSIVAKTMPIEDYSKNMATTEFVKNITGELSNLAHPIPQTDLVAAINYALGNAGGGGGVGGSVGSGVATMNSVYATGSEAPIAVSRTNVFVGPSVIEVGSQVKIIAAYDAQNVLSHIGVITAITNTQVTAVFSTVKSIPYVYDSSRSYKAGSLVVLLGSSMQPADIYYCVADAPVGSSLENAAFFVRISHDLSGIPTETTATDPMTYRVSRLDVRSGGKNYVGGDNVSVAGSDGSSIPGVVAQVGSNGEIIRIEPRDTTTHFSDPKTEFAAAVQGGSGSGAAVAIITYYAPGTVYKDGSLQYVPTGDPLMQKSAVAKAIEDAFGESITLKAIGLVSATEPLPTEHTLKDGMLFYQSSSGSPPNTFPFSVKRWDEVGGVWSAATQQYTPKGFDAWFSTNIQPDGAMYYWNFSKWVDLSFTVDDSSIVHIGGNEIILGAKTFSQSPILPSAAGSLVGTSASPTTAATQKQVQDTAATKQATIAAGTDEYVLGPPAVSGGQPRLVAKSEFLQDFSKLGFKKSSLTKLLYEEGIDFQLGGLQAWLDENVNDTIVEHSVSVKVYGNYSNVDIECRNVFMRGGERFAIIRGAENTVAKTLSVSNCNCFAVNSQNGSLTTPIVVNLVSYNSNVRLEADIVHSNPTPSNPDGLVFGPDKIFVSGDVIAYENSNLDLGCSVVGIEGTLGIDGSSKCLLNTYHTYAYRFAKIDNGGLMTFHAVVKSSDIVASPPLEYDAFENFGQIIDSRPGRPLETYKRETVYKLPLSIESEPISIGGMLTVEAGGDIRSFDDQKITDMAIRNDESGYKVSWNSLAFDGAKTTFKVYNSSGITIPFGSYELAIMYS